MSFLFAMHAGIELFPMSNKSSLSVKIYIVG